MLVLLLVLVLVLVPVLVVLLLVLPCRRHSLPHGLVPSA